MSDDYAVGYRFCVFVVLDIRTLTATMMWVDVLPIEDEDDDEED